MIVSRDPVHYIQACDVMCPHPYMDPQLTDEGQRKFGAPIREIHNTITAAAGANDGSKAIWSMPQTFSYGGLRGQHPTFKESRWFTHTSIACGAKGIVPFIFNGYWNHLESRIGMGYVFEELALLAPAWTDRNSEAKATSDNADVDVVAKFHRPADAARGHTYIVAANQGYGANKATITVPALAENKNTRLLVLRENRIVPVDNGRFTDGFEGLGVHVYTTLEVLPHLKTLGEIEKEIADALSRPAQDGNLLASGKVKWCLYDWGRSFQSDRDIADGVADAAAWFPAYDDRTQCVVKFEKPVRFSRVELYSPSLRNADLDIWADGQWKTIHQWRDQYLEKLTYRGEPVTTDQLRIRPLENRLGYGTWVYSEITELGVYE
jgi:hypothetical protein